VQILRVGIIDRHFFLRDLLSQIEKISNYKYNNDVSWAALAGQAVKAVQVVSQSHPVTWPLIKHK